jgi:hypothetical protein
MLLGFFGFVLMTLPARKVLAAGRFIDLADIDTMR